MNQFNTNCNQSYYPHQNGSTVEQYFHKYKIAISKKTFSIFVISSLYFTVIVLCHKSILKENNFYHENFKLLDNYYQNLTEIFFDIQQRVSDYKESIKINKDSTLNILSIIFQTWGILCIH